MDFVKGKGGDCAARRRRRNDGRWWQRTSFQNLPKHHISLMLWLRTRHISLNQHLHRIGKSLSPNCPHCVDIPETVQHFLLSCPHYTRERHTLTSTLRRQASSITYLLTNAKATAHLIHFVNSTGRLKSTFGDVPPSSR